VRRCVVSFRKMSPARPEPTESYCKATATGRPMSPARGIWLVLDTTRFRKPKPAPITLDSCALSSAIGIGDGTARKSTACSVHTLREGQSIDWRLRPHLQRSSVHSRRDFLATHQPKRFCSHQWLIRIWKSKPQEVLSSREHRPITRMWLEMARQLGCYQCRVCGTFVEVERGYKNLARDDVLKAIAAHKGLIYWHEELADRKYKAGVATHGSEDSYERRVVCRECVVTLLAPSAATRGRATVEQGATARSTEARRRRNHGPRRRAGGPAKHP
jgi:hypothetical protein